MFDKSSEKNWHKIHKRIPPLKEKKSPAESLWRKKNQLILKIPKKYKNSL